MGINQNYELLLELYLPQFSSLLLCPYQLFPCSFDFSSPRLILTLFFYKSLYFWEKWWILIKMYQGLVRESFLDLRTASTCHRQPTSPLLLAFFFYGYTTTFFHLSAWVFLLPIVHLASIHGMHSYSYLWYTLHYNYCIVKWLGL